MMRRGLALILCGLLLADCGDREPKEQTLTLAPYGTVKIFRHDGKQRKAVVLFSGAEGWTPSLSARAWGVSWPDRIVIGVDTPAYLRTLKPSERDGQSCQDHTAGLPALLRAVANATKDPVDPAPLVIGDGIGGTVALLAAAQSQPKSIAGVIAEDFCPRLTDAVPPCPGPGPVTLVRAPDGNGMTLAPPKDMRTPFVAIGDTAQCKAVDLEGFTEAMHDAHMVDPVPDRAIDLLISVADQTATHVASTPALSATALADLPLIEVPGAPGQDDRLAIIMTGDGGWADIDQTIGRDLAARGVAVIGFSTLKYFWHEQSPEKSAADLERVIRHYTEAWNRHRVVLIGYSFGAGVLPFLIPRLPEEVRRDIALTVLLAPPDRGDFEISVGGWIGGSSDEGPEIAPTLKDLPRPVLCIRSEEEDDSPCPPASGDGIESVVLKGDHHFDGAYGDIARRILAKSAPNTAAR